MDSLNFCRPIIERILGEYLEFMANDESVEVISVVDKNEENYVLLETGWQRESRIYNVIFHIRINQEKILIEQDWTREGIAHQLISAGVPTNVIELRYQAPSIRSAAHQQMRQQPSASEI